MSASKQDKKQILGDQNSIGLKQLKENSTSSKPETTKEGQFMKKLNLLGQESKQDENDQEDGLRVEIGMKANSQTMQILSPRDKKWEELIISGRNIQNRSAFSSVIFGSYLYIYGGYEINAGILSDFYRINLDNGTYIWEAVAQKNKSPGKLCRQTAVVYSGKMYMLGGQFIGSLDSNKLFSFDFASGIWDEVLYKNKDGFQFPCIDSHKAIVYKNQMIVISGYLGEKGRYSDFVYSFNFDNKCWSVLWDGQSHPTDFKSRIGTDLALRNDKIYLFGGYDGAERLNDLYYFNLKDNKFVKVIHNNSSDCEHLPKNRKGHTFCLFGDSIFLFGGIHDVTWELDDLFAFDLTNNTWRMIEDDSARRKDQQSVNDLSPTKDRSGKRGSFKRTVHHSQSSIANSLGAPFNNLPSLVKQKTCVIPSPTRSNGSTQSPLFSRKNTFGKTMVQNDPYYVLEEQEENGNSPTKNLQSQKKKEFFQKKADMLAMFSTGDDEEIIMRNNSNSPTSEAMKNALLTIGNPMPDQKVRKGKNMEFGKTTYSKFLEPIKSPTSTRLGKKPCARDGHSAVIYNKKLYIFGGDRHKMSFNDIFALDLEKCGQHQNEQKESNV